jgi:hypothetical protein
MKKVFEDYLSELQADMVSTCFEYAEKRTDKIYIYCSHEHGFITCDFFYCVNGSIVRKHELNDVNDTQDFNYDTSGKRQSIALCAIIENIKKIAELCKAYEKDVPTEIKLIYNVKKSSLNVTYEYDSVHSANFIETTDDIAGEWYAEIKNKQMNR